MNALLSRRQLIAAAPLTVLGAIGLGKPGRAAAPEVPMVPLSAIVPARPPKALPAVGFTTLAGGHRRLADFRGRPLVLNVWATWCIPCVAELPLLDQLAAAGQFQVVAVSADRGGAATVAPFVAAHHITHATILLDPASEAVTALGVEGFPTTLLIGADGRLRGTLEGPADWAKAAPTLQKLLTT